MIRSNIIYNNTNCYLDVQILTRSDSEIQFTLYTNKSLRRGVLIDVVVLPVEDDKGEYVVINAITTRFRGNKFINFLIDSGILEDTGQIANTPSFERGCVYRVNL